MKMSLIVASYNMQRELPRTLYTLSRKYQRDIEGIELEIIVVDNGSQQAPDQAELARIDPCIRVVTVDDPQVSPVTPMNRAVAASTGDCVGIFIDGARMASPGLLSTAAEVMALAPNAVVGAVAMHLGREVQDRALLTGYNQQEEDRLLQTVPWKEDGYRLFEISVFAGSSRHGWTRMPAETNSLFISRQAWDALGGFDERFRCAGGGLANLDLWKRATEEPRLKPFLLFGETTFHQFHGGVATNARESRWEEFLAEYVSIRGHRYSAPTVRPTLFGHPNPAMLARLS